MEGASLAVEIVLCVLFQSQFINQSLFASDWIKLSPKLRREMSIAMAHWIRPMSMRIAKIVPLSLETFISVSIV